MLWCIRTLLIIVINAIQCLASNWTIQDLNFGWQNPLNLPITGHCETLDISWSRTNGSSPQEPYKVKIYTSAYPNLFSLEVGNGTNATVPISFPAGSQYLICINDATGIENGCSDVFAVYPTANTCNPLTAPTATLHVNVTANSNISVASHDRVGYGAELEFDIGENATNGSSTIPPYTVTIVPASGKPLDLISDADSKARWTVSLDVGRQFFISIADKSGYIWVSGPLQVSNNATVPAMVPVAHSCMALPAVLGLAFGLFALGLLLALFCACLLWRCRRKQTSSEKETDAVVLRSAFNSSEKDHKSPLKDSSAYMDGKSGTNRRDYLPGLAVGNPSTHSRTRRRLSKSQTATTRSSVGVEDKTASTAHRVSEPVGTTDKKTTSRSHPSTVSPITGRDPHYFISNPTVRRDMPSADLNHYFAPAPSFEGVKGSYVPYDREVYGSDPRVNLCHIILVIDKSGSMQCDDRQPPQDYSYLARTNNNRYGATLAAVSEFIKACKIIREPEFGHDSDAYSCVLFESDATTAFCYEKEKGYSELLKILMNESADGGTDFINALRRTREIMEQKWETNRLPIVIFLSDGEDSENSADKRERCLRELCERAVQLGKPLGFYSVSFGEERQASSLQGMARTAKEEYKRAVPNAIDEQIPCAYKKTLDAIQIGNAFIDITEALVPHKVALRRRV